MNSQTGLFILNKVSRLTAAFTAATTGILTSVAHGLTTGDRVELTTTTTLPAGLSLNTIYYVMVLSANTFKLSDQKVLDNRAGAVAITDTGTGTHTFTITDVGEAVLVKDFRHKSMVISTDGMSTGDTIVVKIQVSDSINMPNFHLAKSADNEWDYVQVVTLEDGSTIDGDTGISITETDDVIKFAINVDSVSWINVQIITQSDVVNTSVSAKLSLFTN